MVWVKVPSTWEIINLSLNFQISSPSGGDYTFPLVGMCTEPTPQGQWLGDFWLSFLVGLSMRNRKTVTTFIPNHKKVHLRSDPERQWWSNSRISSTSQPSSTWWPIIPVSPFPKPSKQSKPKRLTFSMFSSMPKSRARSKLASWQLPYPKSYPV